MHKLDINIIEKERLIEVDVNGSISFKKIKPILCDLKHYVDRGYRIKIRGYIVRNTVALDAFKYALYLVGCSDIITFENKSKYNKAFRRKARLKAIELKKKGYSIKEISKELNIPMKTVYRWLKA